MFPVSLNSVSNSRGLTNLGKHMFRFEENKFSSTNSTNTTLLNHQRLVCTVGELLRTIHTSEYWVVPGIKVYTEAQGLPKH